MVSFFRPHSLLYLILTPCSAIFQAGGLIVVVVEVTRKAFLASLVPVIVDVILNEHQVVADIVAFVSNGDFPRSRLSEKQRGKVLGSWVTRKLRTLAQFSIRDLGDSPFADLQQQRRASRSSKPGSIMGNSTRLSTMHDVDIPPVPPSPGVAPGLTPGGVALEETVVSQPSAPSPAPVALQETVLSQAPPRKKLPNLDTSTDRSVSRTPVPEPLSAVPYIQEPQSATFVTEDDDHDDPEPAHHEGASEQNRDFRFSFEMISTPIDNTPLAMPTTQQQQSSGAPMSHPSHQDAHGGGFAVSSPPHDDNYRPGTQESGIIDDWQRTAIMYQSALGDGNGHDDQHPHAI